jgi:hypothetical protein
MNAPLSRRDARIANRNAEQLASIGPLRRARSPKKGNVIIAALTEDSIRGRGKVEPPPVFSGFLRPSGTIGIPDTLCFQLGGFA